MPGRIECICVSLPVEVAYRGERHLTGIMKGPVAGPVMIRRLNLDGDRQADLRFHGGPDKAVYAYFAGNYPYWQGALGRSLPQGQFGENLILSGFDEHGLRIGDTLAAGGVRLQVSEPRIPCFKLVMKMEAGGDFSERFLRSGRVGTYLRVLEEGPVAAGDLVAVIGSDSSSPTVAEFLDWTHASTRDLANLRRALGARDLSGEWRAKIRRMIDAGLRQERGLAWTGWRPLAVTRKTPEADGIVSLELAAEDAARLPPHLAGQFLTLQVPTGGADVTRTYSISNASGAPTYRITIKREGAGVASCALHDRVRVGDRLMARAPSGAFHLDPGSRRPLVLIGAGVGLTPLMSMLESAAAPRLRPVRLVAVTRSPGHLPFRERIAELAAADRAVKVDILETGGAKPGRPGAGRVTAGDIPEDAEVYICGPAQFMADVVAALAARGIEAWRIRTESFGPSSLRRHAVRMPAGEGVPVRFDRAGLETSFAEEHGTLLELAEAAGLSPSFGCRAGSCGLCATRLLAGEIELVEPVDQPGDGSILICVTRPKNRCVLDL